MFFARVRTLFVVQYYPPSVWKRIRTSKLSQTRCKVGELWECPDIRLANQKPPRQTFKHPLSLLNRDMHMHRRTFRGHGWMTGSRISARGLVPIGPRTNSVSVLEVSVGDFLKICYDWCYPEAWKCNFGPTKNPVILEQMKANRVYLVQIIIESLLPDYYLREILWFQFWRKTITFADIFTRGCIVLFFLRVRVHCSNFKIINGIIM
jgi:hypothetical protein